MNDKDFTYYQYTLTGIFSPDEDGSLVVFQCEYHGEKKAFAFKGVQDFLTNMDPRYIGKEIFCIKKCENKEYKILFTDNDIFSIWGDLFIQEYQMKAE